MCSRKIGDMNVQVLLTSLWGILEDTIWYVMNKPVTEIYFLRQMNFKNIVAYAFRYKLNEKFVRSKRIRLTARLR